MYSFIGHYYKISLYHKIIDILCKLYSLDFSLPQGQCMFSLGIWAFVHTYIYFRAGTLMLVQANTLVHTPHHQKKNPPPSVLQKNEYRSRVHERTISQFRWGFWEFLDLRFLFLMFTLQSSFEPLLLGVGGGGGFKILSVRWRWIARRKTLKSFVPITSKNSASLF